MSNQEEEAAPNVPPPLDFDGDSAFSGSDMSSTYTISSSIFRYRQENGRSYHAYKDGKYMFPNDEMENNRSRETNYPVHNAPVNAKADVEHHLFLLTLKDKLALAPIGDQVHRVLDVGTGTGHWAIDFAEEHPESEVIGIDLSPVQPAFVPQNCKFEIDDVEDSWDFERKFNFIHSRMMNQAIYDFPKFLQQAFDNLESGGYFEFQDAHIPCRSDDGTLKPYSILSRWCSLMLEGGRRVGRQGSSAQVCKQLMEEAGFVDVMELQFKWPTNPWPEDPHLKELGVWNELNQRLGLEAVSLAFFTRVLGWSVEQLRGFLVELRACVENRDIHAYLPIYIVYGRKPQ